MSRIAAILLTLSLSVRISFGQSPQIGSELLNPLRFRYIGPVGNRVIAAASVPGDPNIYYAGAASGGIFKSTDGGIHWEPIFDDQTVSSIGSLAIAPSDPNVVWAGTGETFIRSHISVGAGIYQSVDAGKTWAPMGLEQTGRIGRVVIDPRTPDIVLACALGHAFGPQPERGVFRTADGGKTWQRVLFVDQNTGCSDVAVDPNNPRILFAGMWQLSLSTWNRTSGGPGSGVYKSTDGGLTWRRLSGHGLPNPPGRQNRHRYRAPLQPRLRAHRNRRRRPLGRAAHPKGPALEIRRWRRPVGDDELRPPTPGTRRLLHALCRFSR